MRISIRPLSPLRELASVQGIVSWSDDKRKIIINKPLRMIYSDLNARRKTVYYHMEFCMDKDKLIERFCEHIENNEFPIFLFFYGEDNNPDLLLDTKVNPSVDVSPCSKVRRRWFRRRFRRLKES